MSLIETHDLSVAYSGTAALQHVNFSISRGEIVTVVGPNGSGKSTFIRALLGILPPSAGRVIVAPDNLQIGYVPQKLTIDPTMPLTVRRFLCLPHRKPRRDLSETAISTGIDLLLEKPMAALSGGQFQRALLARALLTDPDILILDEPTQGLDQPGIAAFYKLIEDVRRDLGCAVLLVSHDLHVVMSASDRVVCLNGHICCEGTPEVVLEAPEYRALFGVGTGGTMALYRHEHSHSHDGDDHSHDHNELTH